MKIVFTQTINVTHSDSIDINWFGARKLGTSIYQGFSLTNPHLGKRQQDAKC